MKNAPAKHLKVILLDGAGKRLVGKECPWYICEHGKAGFALLGSGRVLLWADEGKTWKRAEESR
jgi:hypothetical protein